MIVKVSPYSGFCYGVKRAENIVKDAIKTSKYPIFTLGPLIHNPQVVEKLRGLGVYPITENEIKPPATIIIRSHGIPKSLYNKLKDMKDIELVNATCPFVKKAHRVAETLYNSGYQVVVLGECGHPEVSGIVDYTDNTAIVLDNIDNLEFLLKYKRIGFLAQTTQSRKRFERVVKFLKNHFSHENIKIIDTICDATYKRQEAAKRLAKQADLMIIVGGRNSANTNRLAYICKEFKKPVYHIEESSELRVEWFKDKEIIGISAGASTPLWLVEDVCQRLKTIKEFDMMEWMNEEVLGEEREQDVEIGGDDVKEEAKGNDDVNYEDYMNNLEKLNRGAIVKGRITNISDRDVFVDIGYKSEGIVSINEFEYDKHLLEEGKEVEVMIISLQGYGGAPQLSKVKADEQKAWNKVYDSYKNKKEISGKVVNKIKGGYEVNIDNILKAFLPHSQITEPVNIGDEISFRVIEVNKRRKNIVVSRKILADEIKKKKFWETFKDHKEGDIVKAKVVKIKEYGAFLNYNGVEGLLHVTDMSWGHVRNVSDLLKEGDEIEVKLIKIDNDNLKISFGLKQLKPDPWQVVDENYKEDSIVEGKVTKITNFGVFVELEEGLEGLVHVSDFSWTKRIEHPEDIVKVGDKIKVKVLKIDKENKRISLGIKQLTEDPWKNIVEKYPEGSVIDVVVKDVLKNGITVELDNGVIAFVPGRELSWSKRNVESSSLFKVGDKIKVRIMEIDPDRRRFIVSVRQVNENPWLSIKEKYNPGSIIEGRVTGLAKFGAFIELEAGIEGLIHISDMSWTKRINHPGEMLSVGDIVKVRVLEVKPEEERIALGLKQVVPDPWSEVDKRFPVDSIVEGRVTGLTKFGAFIEIEEGMEGLVHISDFSWTKKIEDPKEMLSVGDIVKVKVINVDPRNKKIKLGIKQVTEDPLSRYTRGSVFEGEISSIKDFGIFVRLEDGIEGLVYRSELPEEDIEKDLNEAYKTGDKITVLILENNREKRQLRLSVKNAVDAKKIEEYKQALDSNIPGGISLADKIREALSKNND